MQLSDKDLILFWAKVDKNGPIPTSCPERGPCWVWTGTIATHCGGYGVFDRRRDGRRVARRAHRISYELLVGRVPHGLLLRHRCDNPPCVNPNHLVPGTALDNSRDMVERRRHWTMKRPERIPRGGEHWTAKKGTASLPRGALHHNIKLYDEDVAEIRRLYSEGNVSQQQLATKFGVSQGLIWQLVSGNRRKEVQCLSPRIN